MNFTAGEVVNCSARSACQTYTAMVKEVTVFYGYSCFFKVITEFGAFNDKLIVTIALVFPEDIIIAIKVGCNSSLNALIYFTWANLIEVFTEVGE